MKQFLKHNDLPWLVLMAGGIGLLLRLWLNSTENEKGFVIRNHISLILLLVLTAAVIGMLLFFCRGLQQAAKYGFNFPASAIGGIGALAAAVGFGITSMTDLFTAGHFLESISAMTGILAAAGLVFVAHSRWKGLHPSLLFHCLICAYLMLRLICMYRSWSSDPQLEDYCFELMALVCAMLTTYHRATFNANFGNRVPYAFFSLSAVYFCCLSLVSQNGALLFLALGVWLFTDLCNLTPMPREYWEKK